MTRANQSLGAQAILSMSSDVSIGDLNSPTHPRKLRSCVPSLALPPPWNAAICLPTDSFVTQRQVLIYSIHCSAPKSSSSHQEEQCQHFPENHSDHNNSRMLGFSPRAAFQERSATITAALLMVMVPCGAGAHSVHVNFYEALFLRAV